MSSAASGWANGNQVQRFRGGLVFKAHRLYVSYNSKLKSNKQEEKNHVSCPVPAQTPTFYQRQVRRFATVEKICW